MNWQRNDHIYAPYSYSLYREYCACIIEKKCRVLRISELSEKSHDAVNVIFRHDIDHIGCILSLPTMLRIEQEFSILSSNYVIIDGSRYDPRILKDLVLNASKSGFEFGLHSNCYLYGDSIARFHEEMGIFEKLYDMKLTNFTQHGSGNIRKEERERFNTIITQDRNQAFSSFATDIRFPYDIKLTDASTQKGKRVMTYTPEAFSQVLDAAPPGSVVLFLSHPFRWSPFTHQHVTINFFNFNIFRG